MTQTAPTPKARLIRALAMWTLAVGAVTGAETLTPDAAPEVTIEVFSDFQCPYCGQFAQPIHELQAKGVEGVRTAVKFRHFPLNFHADAPLAHQAALAAGLQGKFWEMHDLLFVNQSALKRDSLLAYAATLKLDPAKFEKDLDSEGVKKTIQSDQADGGKLGVNGTPTFFVNGKEYTGRRSYEELKKLVTGEKYRARALTEITDNLMSQGPANAPVTLEFFADLQSPVSRPAMTVITELLALYPSAVRLQFRNFPLAFHPQAGVAHDSAMIAAKQGHFWEFAAWILDHQDSLREQDLIAFAGRLGMDQAEFAETLQQHRYTPRVEADLADGLKRGIRGSPVIFVNAKRIDGVPSLQTLKQYVEAELAAITTAGGAR